MNNFQNRLAALEDVENAANKLYLGLTIEQQKTVNELLLLTIPSFMQVANVFSPLMKSSARNGDEREGGMGKDAVPLGHKRLTYCRWGLEHSEMEKI